MRYAAVFNLQNNNKLTVFSTQVLLCVLTKCMHQLCVHAYCSEKTNTLRFLTIAKSIAQIAGRGHSCQFDFWRRHIFKIQTKPFQNN